jgi:hypothetical protein
MMEEVFLVCQSILHSIEATDPTCIRYELQQRWNYVRRDGLLSLIGRQLFGEHDWGTPFFLQSANDLFVM